MGSGARILAFSFLIASIAVAAHGQVTIEQKPAIIEHKTFDAGAKTSAMPALKPGEAAVTEAQFDCTAELTYKVIERKTGDASCAVSLRVQAVHLILSSKVIVWLPTTVPAKLAAHEEGHRQIDQRVYDQAVSDAEKRAQQLEGQTLHASAADCAAAEQKATRTAADDFCREYLKEIGGRAGRINDAYDKITGHGVKATPSEERAVSQAFECDRNVGTKP